MQLVAMFLELPAGALRGRDLPSRFAGRVAGGHGGGVSPAEHYCVEAGQRGGRQGTVEVGQGGFVTNTWGINFASHHLLVSHTCWLEQVMPPNRLKTESDRCTLLARRPR